MKNKSDLNSIIFTAYIVLSFYVFGGGIVNAMVGYRTWSFVGANEFPKFHQIDAQQIFPFFVAFFFISIIPHVLLFWFRPSVINKSLIWATFFLYLIALISTVVIQIPIQKELNDHQSLELIEKLIKTDLMFRRIPMLALAIVNVYMLFKVVSQHSLKMR
jgi:hypothetical protein